MTRVTAHVLSRDLATNYGELDESFARSWLEELNDCGNGTVSLAADDPDVGLLDYGRVVRFSIDGTPRFAFVVEQIDRRAITAGEEADQSVQTSGRGLLALLADAVVYPERGAGWHPIGETRVFDWTSRYIDDTAWAAPVATNNDGWWLPEGWPDPSADWIWDRPAVVPVPAGDVYFRKEFTVAQDVTATLWVTGDDEQEAWVDGVPIARKEANFDTPTAGVANLRLSAGTHIVAVRGVNLNPLLATMRLTIVAEGGTTPLVHSDTSWKCLGYPATPPGFTVGKMLRHLIDEAQARGALAGWVEQFTDAIDTDSAAWAADETFAFQVGTDYLSVVRQIAERGHDVASAPDSLLLRVWRDGGRGAASGVAFAGAVDLTELSHAGEG